ncbi:MAG: choice-of-anchor Q domain-containing protein, partial [Thermoflexales bacterium]
LSYTSNQPAGAGAGIIYGGSAALTLTHSAVVSNQAEYASGMLAYGAPLAHIVNSTVSGNGPSGSTTAQGVVVTGTAYLTHTTVASNTGIGLVSQGAASFHAVLVGYNTSGDCGNWGGSVLAQYASLSSDNSCGAFGFTYTGVNPKLKPLALNGGSTPNHALQVGSPALSAVLGCVVSDDQRGAPRQTPYCDIGAFELIDYRVWAPIVRKP